MEYSDIITVVLIFSAVILIRQILLVSRRNMKDDPQESDYSGKALDPESLGRVDEHSMREFDKLLDNKFPEEE